MNIVQIISEQAQIRPDAIAICTPEMTLSYVQLERLMIQGAQYLYHCGVRSSHVTALRFTNELNALIAFLSCATIGSSVFSISAHTPALMLEESLESVKAETVLTDSVTLHHARVKTIQYEWDKLQTISPDYEASDENPDSYLFILSGSGTTGKSKLIPVTHKQMYERLKLDKECMRLDHTDVVATLVHSDYYVGKLRFLSTMASGGTFCILPKNIRFELSWLERFNITVFHASVFHFENILMDKEWGSKQKVPFLKELWTSMSTVSESLRKRLIDAFNVPLNILYGTNECSALTLLGPDTATDAMSVGKLLKGVELEIVDASNKKVKTGETGYIRARSAAMVDGYLNNLEATEAAFKKGWFYPGDLGRFLENGELLYCGRADHMMIMNGINIYPAEIEAVVSQHPDIIDVAVMPFIHPIHQDIPICAVVVHQASSVTQKDLMQFAFERLGLRSPRELVILDSIPRNENGKLLREALREKIGNQLASRVIRMKKQPVRLKQPTRLYTIHFISPSSIDFTALDQCLTLLEIDPQEYAQTFTTPDHALIWRIMVLIKTLLHHSGIPAFYTGEIIKITKNLSESTKAKAAIRIAYIDHIPQKCYATAIDGAFNTALWMIDNPVTIDNAKRLFKQMDVKIIQSIKKEIPYAQSTVPLLQEAYLKGIPFFHMGNGVYQLGFGAKSRKIDRSTTDRDSAMGSKLSHHKAVSANIMRMAGLPAPKHGVAKSLEDAYTIADELGWPIVVKPSDLDRGEGVSVSITSNHELENAFQIARKRSRNKQVIIERQVEGVCHRLFIAQGRLLYGVKRLPKSLQADGIHTIDELITLGNEAEEKKAPWRRKEPYPRDAEAIQALKMAGYTLESIPPHGEWVDLREIESTQWGGRDEEVSSKIHPDNIEIAIRAAALFELDVAGVDIISSDITTPWHQNGAIINEINFSPLLGGGEISRSHIPDFLRTLIIGNGKIPIEAFVGDDRAIAAALKRQKELQDRGIICFVTSDTQTYNEQQLSMPLEGFGLNYRAKALIHHKQVEALLIVIVNDEILWDEFILGSFNDLNIYSQSVPSIKPPYSDVPTHYFNRYTKRGRS